MPGCTLPSGSLVLVGAVALPAAGLVLPRDSHLETGKPSPGGITLPAGISASDGDIPDSAGQGTTTIPSGTTIAALVTLPGGTTLPRGIILPTVFVVTAGTNLPGGMLLPAGTSLPASIELA